MLRLTFALLAVMLAGTASAAGWRSLRIDASSEAAFTKSLATLQRKLSPPRRYVLDSALEDIQRHYPGEYRRQIDGLGYREIVRFTDPSGETADERYERAVLSYRRMPVRYSGPAFTPPRGYQPPPLVEGRPRGCTTTCP